MRDSRVRSANPTSANMERIGAKSYASTIGNFVFAYPSRRCDESSRQLRILKVTRSFVRLSILCLFE